MSTTDESSCSCWPFHLPSDQQQPDPSSWPSSSSPISTTNIFHVCTRQLLFEALIYCALVTNQPVSSPDHTPNNLTVNIPMCSHVNPSTVIKSTSSPPCLTDAIERSLRVCSGSIFQPTRHF